MNLCSNGHGEPIIFSLVRQMRGELAAALPKLGITPERMMRMAMTCLRQTPKLKDCDQQTVLAAIVQSAQLGLEPTTPLGHCWILPFGSRAQLVIGYKGFVALADRAGITLGAEVVNAKDHWVYPRPGDRVIDHVPYDDEQDEDPGKRLCAYAHATHADGRFHFRVCPRRRIKRARDASAAVRNKRLDSPWFGDENGNPGDTDAMWCKTAIRFFAPFLPLSAEVAPQFARALELDEQSEAGVEQVFDLTAPESRIAAKADELQKKIEQAKPRTVAEAFAADAAEQEAKNADG